MKKDTRYLVSVALMAAIVILLANTPLGMIQLPIIKATTVHIPVIIGAILLGPSAGAILGFVFGVCSLVSRKQLPTLQPTIGPMVIHKGFCRFDGKYDICYGQYLSVLCRTVCRCQRCGTHRGVRPDHGYGHCIRHPGSDCCRNPCHCHHKSTAEGCS